MTDPQAQLPISVRIATLGAAYALVPQPCLATVTALLDLYGIAYELDDETIPAGRGTSLVFVHFGYHEDPSAIQRILDDQP